jgi:hypothetical protein
MAKQARRQRAVGETPKGQPGQAAENDLDEGVRETFPASDAVADTPTQGARAVPPERMMEAGRGGFEDTGTVTVTARFKDQEAAKLAVETMVRDGPIDRRRAEIRSSDDAVLVQVAARPDEAGRVREMLRGCGGK